MSKCSLGVIAIMFWAAASCCGAELLRNGDFEIGVAEEREPKTFVAEGWRRFLWKQETRKSWLISGEFDRRIATANQAVVFTWGATSVYQNLQCAVGSV